MSTMVSNLELIRRVPLFSMLTASQAESVAEAVVKSRFKRGESIVEQGKKSNLLAIILKFRGISEAKMLECLARLGRDIDIVVKPARRRAPGGALGRVNVVFG